MAAGAFSGKHEQIDALNEVQDEAARFLKKIKELGLSLEAYKGSELYNLKERASAVRASLDLTRALAKWRKGR
jgi:hypothetical protein